MNKDRKERQYLTALEVRSGIITLIENGLIVNYCQRGVHKLAKPMLLGLIKEGILDSKALNLKELPSHYTIAFEDAEIMGRAYASFSATRKTR